MFLGRGSGKLHTGRRVQLVVWLQILQEWIGIAGITIYGPTIFTIAGVSAVDRLWVSGLNDITYMFATLICVFTLDRIGRRWTLYWGSVGQGICMFCAGGLARATINAKASGGNTSGVGGAAIFFVFLFTAIFGATWLTVPWLYPAEIFPLEVRARGNAWGVVGWSIGNGWTVCDSQFFPRISHVVKRTVSDEPTRSSSSRQSSPNLKKRPSTSSAPSTSPPSSSSGPSTPKPTNVPSRK